MKSPRISRTSIIDNMVSNVQSGQSDGCLPSNVKPDDYLSDFTSSEFNFGQPQNKSDPYGGKVGTIEDLNAQRPEYQILLDGSFYESANGQLLTPDMTYSNGSTIKQNVKLPSLDELKKLGQFSLSKNDYQADLDYIRKQTGLTLNVAAYIEDHQYAESNKDELFKPGPEKYLRIFGRELNHGVRLYDVVDEIQGHETRGWIGSLSSDGQVKFWDGIRYFAKENKSQDYAFIMCDSDPSSSDYKNKEENYCPDFKKWEFLGDASKIYGKAHLQTAVVAIPKKYFSKPA